MIKLFLFDARTEHSVECPVGYDGKDGRPLFSWDLRTAVRDLVNHIAKEDNVNPLQVMYEQGDGFQIVVLDSESLEKPSHLMGVIDILGNGGQ